MRRAALSTDDHPGNLLSWDGFMQAASANFLQTPSLIIAGESRHGLEIFGSKISFNVWLIFFLSKHTKGGGESDLKSFKASLTGKAGSSWLHVSTPQFCVTSQTQDLPSAKVSSCPHQPRLSVSQDDKIHCYKEVKWQWDQIGKNAHYYS